MAATQRACRGEACQRSRRAETQARWRARNPDYQAGRRLTKRVAQAKAAERGDTEATGEPVRAPPPLWVPQEVRHIPWDQAQVELGVLATDLMVLLVRWALRRLKDSRTGLTP